MEIEIIEMSNSVAYISGFKYQVQDDFFIKIPCLSQFAPLETFYFSIKEDGSVLLKKGFASDGPSGPTIDTPDSIAGAFIHDMLYECMRKGLIPRDFRKTSDKIIRDVCIKHGMPKIRAWMWYYMLRWFGEKNVLASSRRKVKFAP